MRSSKKGHERKHRGNNSLGMVAIVFVTVILLGSLSIESRELAEKRTYYENRAAELRRMITDEEQRTLEIDALRKYMQTDAYTEQVAREKLGLVKENEIVFVEQN